AADRALAERRPAVRVDVAAELLGRLHAVDRAEDVPELAALAADQAALLRERAQRFAGPLGADPGLLADAAALLDELPRGGRRALLHGDLNPGNVLADDDGAGRRRWRAIDPKPVLGDTAFDAWPVLAQVGNPFAEEDPVGVLRAHARVLCATAGLETDRVAAWALARSCESALWRAAELGDRDAALADLAQARAWARLA
ncbi:aminoglycoside phosphotransferase family protein, partial [Georgenia thermotolerans]